MLANPRKDHSSPLFINGFITMCNLKKHLISSAFWVVLHAMFMNGWKQTAKRWQLHFWDYQQSIKKYNSVQRLHRQQFSLTKTNEYLSVSKNTQVFTTSGLKIKFMLWSIYEIIHLCFKPPVSRFFAVFKHELTTRKTLKAFFLQPKL